MDRKGRAWVLCTACRYRAGARPVGHYCTLVGSEGNVRETICNVHVCFPVKGSSDSPGASAAGSSDQA